MWDNVRGDVGDRTLFRSAPPPPTPAHQVLVLPLPCLMSQEGHLTVSLSSIHEGTPPSCSPSPVLFTLVFSLSLSLPHIRYTQPRLPNDLCITSVLLSGKCVLILYDTGVRSKETVGGSEIGYKVVLLLDIQELKLI